MGKTFYIHLMYFDRMRTEYLSEIIEPFLSFKHVKESRKTFAQKYLMLICLIKFINGKKQSNVWNLFKVNNKDTRTISMLFWCLYYYFKTNFTHCSGVSIVEFEQENAGCIIITSQSVITCSKLTIETLEQGVKYVQS